MAEKDEYLIEFPRLDAHYELKRTQFNPKSGFSNSSPTQKERALRFLEEDDIDEQYQLLMHHLMTTAKKNNKEDNVSKGKERSVALKKRKANEGGSCKREDGCDSAEEETNDLQYELFLKHLNGRA